MANQRLELTWFNKNKALIPTEHGRYGYTWVDKHDPRYCETHTLIYDDYVEGVRAPKDEKTVYGPRADLDPQTDNLLITGESGDVLEALTRVPELKAKYLGQVKCIYIDPPFNTGEIFANYEDNLEHSVWLTMMRDRLGHLHKLLSDDGSIWVHLDDVQVHRMRVLLDEVFGPGNFIAQISWEKVAGRDNRSAMSKTCDFILVYVKTGGREKFRLRRNLIPRGGGPDKTGYSNPDNDPRGPWTSGDFTAQYNPEENKREDQFYTLTTPSGQELWPAPGTCWRFTQERYKELLADDRVWFGADGQKGPRLKRFLSEVQDGLVPKTLWAQSEVGTNDSAKKETKALLPGAEVFDTPKPERLLERIIHIASSPGDVVLDVFAGSGTTAAVAQKTGRRWVTCELLAAVMTKYTRPRLTTVVNGQDPGGITVVKGERIAVDGIELPEDMTPDDAQKLTSLINKAVKNDPGLKDAPSIKELKARVKTRKTKDALNWRGGGGFQTAHLSPAVFDFDPDFRQVVLTTAAADYDTLAASVAAQLKFWRTPPGSYFQGTQGGQRLAVVDALLTPDVVDDLVAHVEPGASLTIAATSVDDEAYGALRKALRGSRIVRVPEDLFPIAEANKED